MPIPFKLRKRAKELGVTERDLVISMIETSSSRREAARKLGISEGGVRAAIIRLNITVSPRRMKVLS